ncbi:MAG: 50S ribosome-binding GTPase [Sedimentisphaerales bacterium]|nr:50S ribosome-binding GTPase [Sedimentisphaerales bacterium]
MENETFAGVMTGKGTGAIATVQVCGKNAESIIKTVFKSVSTKPLRFEVGQILLGTIHDNSKIIDQVTIGYERPYLFAIHCHGNPLIVEMIIQLLKKQGVQIISDELIQKKILSKHEQTNIIALEAKIAQVQSKTIEGTKIILNQIDSGLSKVVREWLSDINSLSLDLIKKQTDEILQNSSIAKLIISGCKTILTGPPNSGKSTLLNFLSGKQKSIVTDISGTTRDWVTAQCQIESLSLELIDTAGLDDNLSTISKSIDNAAQNKALELINEADLILLVLDNSRDIEFNYSVFHNYKRKTIITVLNKSDLPQKFNKSRLPDFLSNTIQISAKNQTGSEGLLSSIRQTLGLINFNLHTPICFNDRQLSLLKKLKLLESKQRAATIMNELLNNSKEICRCE